MESALIIDASLLAISLMMTLILTVAWFDFERPSHALTWAIGFAVLAAIWPIEIAMRRGGLGSDSRTVIVALGALASSCNTIGFRQRASWPSRAAILLPASLLPPLGAMLLCSGVSGAAALAPLDLYNAVMFALAARTLVGRRRSERAAQRAAHIGLVAFTLMSAGLFVAKLPALGGYRIHDLSWTSMAILPLLPASITGIGLFTIFLLAADLADQTRRLSATDMLSGLLNRRGFEGAARPLLEAASAGGRPITLMLVDIDHFKDVNDSFGHSVGDRVIAQVARLLATRTGRRDLAARIGGEEFAVLMADRGLAAAAAAAEAMRAALCAGDFALPDERPVTASFGLAQTMPGATQLADLFARADRALYRAKHCGRNQVMVADDAAPGSRPSDPIETAAR